MRIADQIGVDCPVFYVDNVARYCRSIGSFSTNDLPSIAPPFRELWMEYAVESRQALRITALDADKFSRLQECKWTLLMQRYFCPFGSDDLQLSLRNAYIHVRSDGSIYGFTVVDIDPQTKEMSQVTGEESEDALAFCAPAMLSIAFMHCKNVRHVENEPTGQRARRRRGEKPLLRYYTLEIDPMREVLRKEGQSETVGLKQALHICRGHFKDYRQSGLFGRIKGIFWWDQQLRGAPTEGVVVKDYAVKAPVAAGETVH